MDATRQCFFVRYRFRQLHAHVMSLRPHISLRKTLVRSLVFGPPNLRVVRLGGIQNLSCSRFSSQPQFRRNLYVAVGRQSPLAAASYLFFSHIQHVRGRSDAPVAKYRRSVPLCSTFSNLQGSEDVWLIHGAEAGANFLLPQNSADI